MSQTTKHYGDAVTAPVTVPVRGPTPTYVYTFYGWEEYSHNMTVTKDVEFEAMFTETFREYTVTFLFKNQVYRSDRLHYQATIALPLENPSIPSDDTYDHVFAEWEGYTEGMKVTVGLPYVLGEGKDPNRLSIYYISDGKVAEEIECQYENDSVTFTLGHFSTYAIMYDDSVPSDGEFPVLYAVIGAVAVIAVAGAVFFSSSGSAETVMRGICPVIFDRIGICIEKPSLACSSVETLV